MTKLKQYFSIGIKGRDSGGDITECPPGTLYNPETNQCEPEGGGECPIGFTKDLFTDGCIKIPATSDVSDRPVDAYYMQPNQDGDFTQDMFDTAIANGHRFIVLDIEVWNIMYQEYPEKPIHRTWEKISIYERFEENNPLIIDARTCFINCYHNKNSILDNHYVFAPTRASNIHFKFGHVEGDKYKRDFEQGSGEHMHESTALVNSVVGSKNITIEGEYISGFMADAFTASSVTAELLNFNGRHYKIDGENNKFQSPWYDLTEQYNLKYGTLSFSTGNGYNRIPSFDLFNFTTVFLDSNDNEIQRLEGCEFLKDIPIPTGARKVSTIVTDLTGVRLATNEEYIQYGNPFGYSVSSNVSILNTTITDNHRGGLGNLGPYAIVDNCVFYNTQRYWDTTKFGDPTRYEINLEDAISKDAEIKNCNFKGKFHSILLVSNVSALIYNNQVSSNRAISIRGLIQGAVFNNTIGDISKPEEENIVSGSTSNNYGAVEVYNNTGSAKINLSHGSVFRDNDFNKGSITGIGFCRNNIFRNFNLSYTPYTKDFHDNTFIGMDMDSTPYVREAVDVLNNNFTDCWFNFHHGEYEDEYRIFEGCTFQGKIYKPNNSLQQSFVKSFSDTINIFKNCDFDAQTFHHRASNYSPEKRQTDWYFENCNFINMEGLFFDTYTNSDPAIIKPKLVFKNCTFEGEGQFINTGIRTIEMDITLHNCTIDPRIALPATYSTLDTSIPQREKELSTRDLMTFIVHPLYIEVQNLYRRTQLLIKNTSTSHQETVLAAKFYHYYLDGQNVEDIEFSVDNGRTWEKPE